MAAGPGLPPPLRAVAPGRQAGAHPARQHGQPQRGRHRLLLLRQAPVAVHTSASYMEDF